MRAFSSAAAAVLVGQVSGSAAPSCKSDSGANVDYAYAFKYPSGFEYAYMDSENSLAKSSHTLNTEASSISKTLAQIHEDVSVIFWNDQPAPTGSSEHPEAHAKGLLVFGGTGGFWLTHSLPHFPAPDARSAAALWKYGSDDFGQSFLCITIDAEELSKISQVMKINRPNVYHTKFTSAATDEIKEWAQDKKWNDELMTISTTVKSKGGQVFDVFGKSGNWGTGKDLYRDLVAPAVGSVYFEGWRRGAGLWGPACGKAEVLDVLSIAMPDRTWETTYDHSKWAVTQSGSVFCVGDINRADGQDGRGGGTVCIHHEPYANTFRKAIQTTDKCRKHVREVVV